jgi:hypothetical protein
VAAGNGLGILRRRRRRRCVEGSPKKERGKDPV